MVLFDESSAQVINSLMDFHSQHIKPFQRPVWKFGGVLTKKVTARKSRLVTTDAPIPLSKGLCLIFPLFFPAGSAANPCLFIPSFSSSRSVRIRSLLTPRRSSRELHVFGDSAEESERMRGSCPPSERVTSPVQFDLCGLGLALLGARMLITAYWAYF